MKIHKIRSTDRNQAFTQDVDDILCLIPNGDRLANFWEVTNYWKNVTCKHCLKKRKKVRS